MARTLAQGTDITKRYAPKTCGIYSLLSHMPSLAARRCVLLLGMSRPRRGVAVLVSTLVLMVTAGLVTGCGGSPPKPEVTADAYLADWARQDWTAMQKLVS